MAGILASNLLSTFNKEMGRKELHSRMFLPFLWINNIIACLIVSGSKPDSNDSSQTRSRIGASLLANLKKIRSGIHPVQEISHFEPRCLLQL